jgi:hypothetical protein
LALTQIVFNSIDRSLGSVYEIEFGQNIGDVVFHSALTHMKGIGDFFMIFPSVRQRYESQFQSPQLAPL